MRTFFFRSHQYFSNFLGIFPNILELFQVSKMLNLRSIFQNFLHPLNPLFLTTVSSRCTSIFPFFRRLLRKENRHFFRKENRRLLRKENILLLPIKHLKNKEWIKRVITSELNTNVVHFQMQNEHLHLCQIFIMKYKSNI